MSHPDTDFQRLLAANDACGPARQWVGDRTLAEAWAECPDGTWMLWLHDWGVVQIGHVSIDVAWEAYRKATASPRSYYYAAVATAQATRDKALAEAGDSCREALGLARDAYDQALAKAEAAYRKATASARKALAEAIRKAHPEPPSMEDR